MNSRDSILAKVKAATSARKDQAPLPQYDPAVTHSGYKLEGGDTVEIFTRNLAAVNGKSMRNVGELADFLQANGHTHGYCDPALYDSLGAALASTGLTIETDYDRNRYDDYQFGITRATGAIAESGTLIIDDEHTTRRLAALTPWVHVAVVSTSSIHRTISDALAHLGDASNVTWITGPSKTADVEGILIEGVHGPGEQIAFLI